MYVHTNNYFILRLHVRTHVHDKTNAMNNEKKKKKIENYRVKRVVYRVICQARDNSTPLSILVKKSSL